MTFTPPRICFRCHEPVTGRARFCQREACVRARRQAYEAARPRRQRCLYCPRERQFGKPWCEQHSAKRDRCRCGQPVPLHAGPGRQPGVCADCDAARPPSKRRVREDERMVANG